MEETWSALGCKIYPIRRKEKEKLVLDRETDAPMEHRERNDDLRSVRLWHRHEKCMFVCV